MTPEVLWHITGTEYAPRRCRHRVLLEAGSFFIVQATCRRLPDPSEDWKNESFPVSQIPRSAVDRGGRWSSSKPPLPPKKPRPVRPEPLPWTSIPWSVLEGVLHSHDAWNDAAALGLSWPCTEEEVRASFRRKVREVHPDTGGTAEGFVRLKASHDRLLEGLKGRRASA